MQTRTTIKTLGAAALGVAFAAAAAGTASAADSVVPALPSTDPTTVAHTVLTGLPVGQTAKLLPGGSGAGDAAQTTLTGAAATLPQAAGRALQPLPGSKNAGLLGGLPIGANGSPLG